MNKKSFMFILFFMMISWIGCRHELLLLSHEVLVPWIADSSKDYCRRPIASLLQGKPMNFKLHTKGFTMHGDSLENLAESYRNSGGLQQAIWIYRALEEQDSRALLEKELKEILNEKAKEVVPHVFVAGTVPKLLLKFRDGVQALFKPARMNSYYWENPEFEAVAYQVDHTFDLGIVPMTVFQKVRFPNQKSLAGCEDSSQHDGCLGSLQVWLKDVSHGTSQDAQSSSFLSLRILDFLLKNGDRTRLNVLSWGKMGWLVAIDHGDSFNHLIDECGQVDDLVAYLKQSKRLSQHFIHFDEEKFLHKIDPLFSSERMKEKGELLNRIHSIREQLVEL
jgi:hypothetical protein